jgi:hypothetical protein
VEILVLGCGNRFSLDLNSASLLVKEGNVSLLVNCGPAIPKVLHQRNLIPKITHVFPQDGSFTSIGGLEMLGLRSKALYAHHPVLLFYKWFNPFLMARLSSEFFNPETAFKVHDLTGIAAIGEDFIVSPVPGDNGGCALGITVGEVKVLITGCQPAPAKQKFKIPYADWTHIIHHVAFDGELANCASYKELLEQLPAKDNLHLIGYRDRDRISSLDLNVDVLREGQTLSF